MKKIMFTGLIDHFSTISALDDAPNSRRLWIESAFNQLEIGESIAVNGICVTVVENKDTLFSCDLSSETLRVTNAGSYQPGSKVNLERALLPTTRLGGHFVTGHVDQVCSVANIQKNGEFVEMQFSGITPETRKLMITKGSIAVNGVSLTINSVTANSFSVMLIPHTLQRTNLQFLNLNDTINVEFDMMAKFIAEQYQNYVNRS